MLLADLLGPGATVQFKFWVAHANYDQPDASDFAGQTFTVEIHESEGRKGLQEASRPTPTAASTASSSSPRTRRWASIRSSFRNHGGGSFRVEEYKKPEFEVTVEAPTKPVMLGEKITATIKAKYYFGAPVTKAKVKYKVTRTTADARWYPPALGLVLRPRLLVVRRRLDVVSRLVALGLPGRALAWWGIRRHRPKSWPKTKCRSARRHGRGRHRHGARQGCPSRSGPQYEITAEVVDESRRTIVGTGNVLVARKPFKVFAWVDRGYYRAGDAIEASFHAQTLDRKPVEGKGS